MVWVQEGVCAPRFVNMPGRCHFCVKQSSVNRINVYKLTRLLSSLSFVVRTFEVGKKNLRNPTSITRERAMLDESNSHLGRDESFSQVMPHR
jgi:hypothetical protein